MPKKTSKKKTKKKAKTISRVKKKIAKKKITKKRKTKKRQYNVLKKLGMDDIYKILNKVQISRKVARFSVEHDDAATIENVILDLKIPFERKNLKTKTVFVVSPGPDQEDEEIEFEGIEFFEDELVESGKIF